MTNWLLNLHNLPLLPEKKRWLLIFLICALWLGITAGLRPLMIPDEGRYVGVAWEMLQSGSLATPLLDGMPYFHKPPLFYWLTLFSIKIFGANVWSARFASILAASGAATGLFVFVRRYVNERTAAFTLVVLLTQPFFFAGAQFANLDMLVAAMISLCILSAADVVFRAEAGEKYRGRLSVAYAFSALGLLAKGLIGIVLPGAVLFVWILLTRRFKSIRVLLSPVGIGLFGLIGLPWFMLMQQHFRGFFDYFVIYHHFQRFSETGFNNRQPLWFYVPTLFALTLPWSPWLWQAVRTFNAPRESRHRDIQWLMLCWIVLILVFFSIPVSKPVGYIMPALPALAFLIAAPFARQLEPLRLLKAQRYLSLNTIAGAGVCVAVLIGVANHDYVASANQLAPKIREAFSEHDRVAMIERYQYDLPFYLRLDRPAWVISNWDDPSISAHDNWRKELYDAKQFDHAAGIDTLLTYAQFSQRICNVREVESIWVWGTEADRQRLDILANLTPYASHNEQRVWRLTPEIRLNYCERPTNGSAQT